MVLYTNGHLSSGKATLLKFKPSTNHFNQKQPSRRHRMDAYGSHVFHLSQREREEVLQLALMLFLINDHIRATNVSQTILK